MVDSTPQAIALETLIGITKLFFKETPRYAAIIVPLLASGLAKKPDSRKREILIRLAGCISQGLKEFAKDNIKPLNSILSIIYKALKDPVVYLLFSHHLCAHPRLTQTHSRLKLRMK